MAKKFSVKTNLHRRDIRGVSTYVVLREASDHFKETGIIEVIGFIDNHPIEGALQPKTDGSHWLTIKKEWREAIGKTIGDSVEISIEIKKKIPPPQKVKKKLF
ncbi:MAG: DUF1905 domain-containing protein [Bacteroidetes bacterium]|mgnify:FL=1|jgi:hypothetical protein|nr:DUF1905 domain-containing protein [Bacteroidota bacterium]HQP00962.1 DUF1905 domain-containing protein [Bacteroidia bacterium]HRF14753.1 DUF1905 domain-containing protein [Bacteroidia bacterium]HRH82880.1 DUF1905 domain-containing protein [Bacteroidia bacterium]HRR23633.1 DUF1905 domain-containing protein [Bacteroidia bacterium]